MFVHKWRVMPRIFLIALLSTFLTSCYGTDYEVLTSGEKIPFSGNFVCKLMGQIQQMNLQNTSGGFFNKSYEYYDSSDGTTNRFKNLGGDFFLLQSKQKAASQLKIGAKYFFVYYQFERSRKITVYVADLMSMSMPGGNKSPEARAIASIAKRYSINLQRGEKLAKLYGTPMNTKIFLIRHNKKMLRKLGECIHE
jgi:hypothetical protein